jgi:hypothetical protein
MLRRSGPGLQSLDPASSATYPACSGETFARCPLGTAARGGANLVALLDEADAYVARNALDLPEEPDARQLDPDPECMTDPILELDLAKAGITSIVWATGYTVDYSWLKVDAFDERGRPKHQRGVSAEPGIYFLGVPWGSASPAAASPSKPLTFRPARSSGFTLAGDQHWHCRRKFDLDPCRWFVAQPLRPRKSPVAGHQPENVKDRSNDYDCEDNPLHRREWLGTSLTPCDHVEWCSRREAREPIHFLAVVGIHESGFRNRRVDRYIRTKMYANLWRLIGHRHLIASSLC